MILVFPSFLSTVQINLSLKISLEINLKIVATHPTPETLTTLNLTPGISPLALPFRPKPERRTSSFSSTKLRQPSFGTNDQY